MTCRYLVASLLLLVACATPEGTDTADTDTAADSGDSGCDAVPETCNGADDDCDGEVDEDAVDAATGYRDADGDGFGDPAVPHTACELPDDVVADATDCDDAAADVHPGAEETCFDGIDQDCAPGGIGCRRTGSHSIDNVNAVDFRVLGEGESGIGEVFALADLDGDGVDELAVGAIGDGHEAAWVFRGPITADRSLGDAAMSVHGDDTTGRFGGNVALLADRDGDGLGQLAVGDEIGGGDGYPGGLYFYSRAGELDVNDDDVRVRGEDAYGLFTTWLGDVGDVDGDGTVDFGVGAPEANSRGTGALYIWSGAPEVNGSALTADFTLSCTEGGVGWSAAGGFDWTGDGLDDVAVGAPESGPGAVYVIEGPLSAGETLVDGGAAFASIRGDAADTWTGWDLVVVGDQDGDGLEDLAVAAPWTAADGGEVRVYAGGAAGEVAWDADLARITGYGGGDVLGFDLAAGDHDGDGVTDLAAAAPGSSPGRVWVWFGPLSGSVTTDAVAAGQAALVGGLADVPLEGSVRLGDLDGDGLDDMVYGSRIAGAGDGAVYVVLGLGE